MSLASDLRNTTNLSGVFGGHAAHDLEDHAAGYTLDGIAKINRSAGFSSPNTDEDSESVNNDRKKAALEEAGVAERQQTATRQRYRHNMLGKTQAFYYNISDRGDYFYVWGHDRANPNSPYGPRKMSNAQLRKVLIDGILNKGWDTIYFYRHNAIDFETAQRARSILMMELSQTLKLAGIDDKKLSTMISFKLMDDPEPWAGPLRHLFGHATSVKLKEWEMSRIMRGRTRRENRGLLGNVAIEPSVPEPN